MKKEQKRIAAEIRALERRLEMARTNMASIRSRLSDCLEFLSNCHDSYLNAPPQLRRMMNQAVFDKFLVGSDGSTEALPTDEFGVLLRPDFVLLKADDVKRVPAGEIAVHRNSQWANGIPVGLVKVLEKDRRPNHDRTSAQSRTRHPRRAGLNKTHLAEGVGFEPTVPIGHSGFRDRPIRPLSHPSEDTSRPSARGGPIGSGLPSEDANPRS